MVLALERDLEKRSARLIAIELFGASWIEDAGAWHDGLAERGTARRRIEKARDLRKGGFRDLVSGRAKPWRTARVSGGKAGRKGKSGAATPPLDPDWLPGARDGLREPAADDDEGYVDTRAAAAYVGLSVRTLRRMRREDRGPPYVRKGRRVLYDLRALDTWMKEDG